MRKYLILLLLLTWCAAVAQARFPSRSLNAAGELRTSDPITVLAFAPDGKTVVAATKGRVLVWDVATWSPKKPLEGHAGYVECLSFKGDGTVLATGGDMRDGLIKVWDMQTGEVTHTFNQSQTTGAGNRVGLTSLAFSADGKILAAAGTNHKITIWDLGTGKASHVLEGLDYPTSALSWSSDGKYLRAAGGGGTGRPAVDQNGDPTGLPEAVTAFYLWDVRTWEVEAHSVIPNAGYIGTFSPDGKYLAVLGAGPYMSPTSSG